MTPDRDPFGRAPGDPSPAPRPRTPRRPDRRWAVRIAVAVAVVLTGLVVVGLVGGDDEPSPAEERRVLESFRGTGGPPRPPAGLLTRSGSRAAFARLRTRIRPGERVVALSLRPDYLLAQVATGDGAPLRLVSIREDADRDSESDGGTSDRPGVPFAQIDPRGPARLVAAARRGLGPGSSAIAEGVVLNTVERPDESRGWTVTFSGGGPEDETWTSDGSGDHVVRQSDAAPAPPAGAEGPAVRPSGTTGTSLVRTRNLRRALVAVEREIGPDAAVAEVDVRPTVVAVRVGRGGGERTYRVDASLGVRVEDLPDPVEGGGIPLAQVDASGPERALRRIDAQAGGRASARVESVTLVLATPGPSGPRTAWRIQLASGAASGGDVDVGDTWEARLDGRRVGRPGETPAP